MCESYPCPFFSSCSVNRIFTTTAWFATLRNKKTETNKNFYETGSQWCEWPKSGCEKRGHPHPTVALAKYLVCTIRRGRWSMVNTHLSLFSLRSDGGSCKPSSSEYCGPPRTMSSCGFLFWCHLERDAGLEDAASPAGVELHRTSIQHLDPDRKVRLVGLLHQVVFHAIRRPLLPRKRTPFGGEGGGGVTTYHAWS